MGQLFQKLSTSNTDVVGKTTDTKKTLLLKDPGILILENNIDASIILIAKRMRKYTSEYTLEERENINIDFELFKKNCFHYGYLITILNKMPHINANYCCEKSQKEEIFLWSVNLIQQLEGSKKAIEILRKTDDCDESSQNLFFEYIYQTKKNMIESINKIINLNDFKCYGLDYNF